MNNLSHSLSLGWEESLAHQIQSTEEITDRSSWVMKSAARCLKQLKAFIHQWETSPGANIVIRLNAISITQEVNRRSVEQN